MIRDEDKEGRVRWRGRQTDTRTEMECKNWRQKGGRCENVTNIRKNQRSQSDCMQNKYKGERSPFSAFSVSSKYERGGGGKQKLRMVRRRTEIPKGKGAWLFAALPLSFRFLAHLRVLFLLSNKPPLIWQRKGEEGMAEALVRDSSPRLSTKSERLCVCERERSGRAATRFLLLASCFFSPSFSTYHYIITNCLVFRFIYLFLFRHRSPDPFGSTFNRDSAVHT